MRRELNCNARRCEVAIDRSLRSAQQLWPSAPLLLLHSTHGSAKLLSGYRITIDCSAKGHLQKLVRFQHCGRRFVPVDWGIAQGKSAWCCRWRSAQCGWICRIAVVGVELKVALLLCFSMLMRTRTASVVRT